MGVIARVRSGAGGPTPKTVTAATTTYLPSESTNVYFTGTATITSLVPDKPMPGRMVRIMGDASATVTFTNTNNPTTAGQMDLGGSNFSMGSTDVLQLVLQPNGTWLKVGSSDN